MMHPLINQHVSLRIYRQCLCFMALRVVSMRLTVMRLKAKTTGRTPT